MSETAFLEKCVADNVEVINFANFLSSNGVNVEFSNLQSAVANMGYTFPGLSNGIVEGLTQKYGQNGVAVLTAWNAILISAIQFGTPSYTPPVPKPVSPVAPVPPVVVSSSPPKIVGPAA
jgi:hypothetical protein